MTFENMLCAGVILLYSLATLSVFIGTLSMRRCIKVAANWVTLAGFAVHTLSVLVVLFSHTLDELSAGYFLQLLSWLVILLYLAAWRFLRLPFLAITASPLALLLYLMSLKLSNITSVLPEHLAGLFLALHICSLFISLGLLTMAFGSGLLFVYLESKIKTKTPLADFARDLPSLNIFDKVNKTAVIVGFPLYTLGLMSSFIWLPLSQAQLGNPKVLLSLFTWFLYALLFYQRTALGYQGRKTALMAIVIFTISALSVALDFFITHHSSLLQPYHG